MLRSILAMVATLVVSQALADGYSSNSWKYVGTAEHRPAARAVGLSEDVPPDFQEDVSYQSEQRQYAQLRYGSENSRRVVIVIEDLGDRAYQFYADLNRDRILTDEELLEGSGRTRRFSLPTEIIKEDQAEQTDRTVELKLGITGKRLSVATVGFIEGHVHSLANAKQPVRVRRLDGNANGLFADTRDRLLVDLDGDESWNPIAEQFAYLPIVKLHDRRYAVRSDRVGAKLSLTEIEGTGNLRVSVAALPKKTKVVGFEAMVFSNDGSAYSLKSLDESLEVPVGKYLLGSVTLTLDTGEKKPWHFVFSRTRKISEDEWNQVVANSDVTLEAIGKTHFKLGVEQRDSFRPGAAVRVSPAMYTECGLLINLCSRGMQMGSFDRDRYHNPCHIKLTDNAGAALGSARSGFA